MWTSRLGLIFERTTLFSQSTRILVDAMKAAGVKRLIAVTGLGAGDSRGHGGLLYDAVVFPLLLKRVYDDKDVQEWIVRSSGLDWTIVRPGLLTRQPRNWSLPGPDRAKGLAIRRYQSCGRRGLHRAAGRRPCINRCHTSSHQLIHRKAPWITQKKRVLLVSTT